MTSNRKLIIAVLLAFLVGWWWSSSDPQPWTPHKDRPWLTWMARSAKRLLWIAIVADPPPEDVEPDTRQAVVGEDGFRVVEHRRGW